MMNPQHRQPLAAFAVLVCIATLAIGNDLRKTAVEILTERSSPQLLVSALAPDMVISESLRSRSPSRDEARAAGGGSTPRADRSRRSLRAAQPLQRDVAAATDIDPFRRAPAGFGGQLRNARPLPTRCLLPDHRHGVRA